MAKSWMTSCYKTSPLIFIGSTLLIVALVYVIACHVCRCASSCNVSEITNSLLLLLLWLIRNIGTGYKVLSFCYNAHICIFLHLWRPLASNITSLVKLIDEFTSLFLPYLWTFLGRHVVGMKSSVIN